LADELVRQYSAYVTPAPPPGLPAYQYLVAVTGERFRREAGLAYAYAPTSAWAAQMPIGPNAWAHSGRRH
jgi:hypothetical protein